MLSGAVVHELLQHGLELRREQLVRLRTAEHDIDKSHAPPRHNGELKHASCLISYDARAYIGSRSY